MQPHEHLAIVLKQFEDIMSKPKEKAMRDPVLVDLNREMNRRENEEILEERAQSYYKDELQVFMNSAPDILEALSEQSEEFIKGLLKHPEIAKACETYFHFMAMDEARKRARNE